MFFGHQRADFREKLIRAGPNAHECNYQVRSWLVKYFSHKGPETSFSADVRMFFGHQRADNGPIFVKN